MDTEQALSKPPHQPHCKSISPQTLSTIHPPLYLIGLHFQWHCTTPHMNTIISLHLSRSPVLLQSIVERIGHYLDGGRMADRNREHKHVHLRNCTCVHSHGERRPVQDARDNRLELRRFHSCTWWIHIELVRVPRRSP